MDWSVPIQTGTLDPGNWTARYSNMLYTASWVDAAGGGLVVSWTSTVPDAGLDVINYAPPPFDVISVGGSVPAPAFSGYPIT